jgi:hypothetical protein
MQSGNSISSGYRVSEKSKDQKSSDSRQKKKAKIAAKVQALKDLEHGNSVLKQERTELQQENTILREVSVLQFSNWVKSQIVVGDQRKRIDQLQNEARTFEFQADCLQVDLDCAVVVRQQAEQQAVQAQKCSAEAVHCFENLKRSNRGATGVALNGFLKSFGTSNDIIPSAPSNAACDSD